MSKSGYSRIQPEDGGTSTVQDGDDLVLLSNQDDQKQKRTDEENEDINVSSSSSSSIDISHYAKHKSSGNGKNGASNGNRKDIIEIAAVGGNNDEIQINDDDEEAEGLISDISRRKKCGKRTYRRVFVSVILILCFLLIIIGVSLNQQNPKYDDPTGENDHHDDKGTETTAPPTSISTTGTGTDTTNNKNNQNNKDDEYEEVQPSDMMGVLKDINELQDGLRAYYAAAAGNPLWEGMGIGPEDQGFGEGLIKIAQNMVLAIKKKRAFVIGSIGDDIVTGRGNCYADAYQKSMEKRIKILFWKLKADFVVRNAGRGSNCGDTFVNHYLCFSNLVGDDVDVIHYSWSLLEQGKQEEAGSIHEHLIRMAMRLPRAPSVHFLSMNGGESGETMDQKKESCLKDLISPDTVKMKTDFFETYNKHGTHIFCLELALWSTELYLGKQWGKIGDGMHSTTREGELLDETDEKNKQRKQSLGVLWRDWRPGPLGLQMISDMYVMYYTTALKIALEALVTGNRPNLTKDRVKLPETFNPKDDVASVEADKDVSIDDDRFPKNPIICKSEACKSGKKIECKELGNPTFGKSNVKLYDMTTWDFSGSLYSQNSLKHIPLAERNDKDCGYIDTCGFYTSSNPSKGILQFTIPTDAISEGIIAVCCCCEKKCATNQFLDDRVKFVVNGVEIENNKKLQLLAIEGIESGKCVDLLSSLSDGSDGEPSGRDIYLSKGISQGYHKIEISVKKETTDQITISQVFGL